MKPVPLGRNWMLTVSHISGGWTEEILGRLGVNGVRVMREGVSPNFYLSNSIVLSSQSLSRIPP